MFHLSWLNFYLVKVIDIISLMYCRQVALISDTVLTLYCLPFTFRDTFLLQLVMDFSCLMQCQVYICTSNQFKLTTVAITYICCCIKWYITQTLYVIIIPPHTVIMWYGELNYIGLLRIQLYCLLIRLGTEDEYWNKFISNDHWFELLYCCLFFVWVSFASL